MRFAIYDCNDPNERGRLGLERWFVGRPLSILVHKRKMVQRESSKDVYNVVQQDATLNTWRREIV